MSFRRVVIGFIAVAIGFAQSQSAKPLAFEVASVKPSKPGGRGGGIRPLPGGQSYVATNAPVRLMIKLMYKITDSQIVGGPGWMDTDFYDVDAKAERPSSLDDLHEMFQTLLADSFQLKFHRETREIQAYVLTVDKSGSKMKLNESPDPFEIPIRGLGRGKIAGQRTPMVYFAWFLAQQFNRAVVDKTGLDRFYDFNLEWAQELPPGFVLPEGREAPPSADGPDIFTALREQLGLRLESKKAPVQVFVIDHVERPAN